MRKALVALTLAAAACSPRPRRAFPIGFLEPVSAGVSSEVRRLELEVSAAAPADVAVVSAAVPVGGGEVMADWARLRFLTAHAVAEGSGGLFFRLPRVTGGRDILDYPEEWQALGRVLREWLAMRPVLQGGSPAPAPFAVPAGIEGRAWNSQGRLYVLLVNSSGRALPLEEKDLAPWRALFAVRSDARQVLVSCGARLCLPAEGVIWLEGRPLPESLP